MKTIENKVTELGKINIITIGYNMKCKFVLTKGILYKENNRYCLKTQGIDMYCDDLSDILEDTLENRKILKNKINEKNN